MTFEISKYALMDRVREKKEIEDAIAAASEGNGGGADLGSYLSIEQLALDGTPVALDPEIHTSWLQTVGLGPTTLTLISPRPFSVGLRKLIFCETFSSAGDDLSLNPGVIKTSGGGAISSITFTGAPQWLLIEAWDTDNWRVVRSSGVTIV